MKDTLREVDVLAGPALKDSELRYRRLFEAAQDGILILDARTGMIEDVNPFLMKMLDYSREEFVEKKLWEVGAFKDIEASQEAFEALQENEYIRYEDLPLKTKYGRLIQVEFVSNVYFVDGEKVIQCNIRDITERKRAEEALQASQLIIEEIINAIPMRVFWKDKNLVYLGCNAAFAHDAGFTDSKDVIGKDDYQMGWRDQAELYRGDDRQVIESGSTKLNVQDPQTTPEGNIITLLTSKVPLRNSKEETIGVLGMYMDITERKRAEEAVRDSEKHFRALIENSSDAITLLDAKGIAIYDSPASPGMLGYAPEDWIGRDVFALIHPDDLPKSRDLFQHLGETPGDRVTLTFRVRHKSGSWLWIEMVATNLLAEPSVQAIVLNYRDITDRKQAEETLQETQAHLRAVLNNVPITIFATDSHGVFTLSEGKGLEHVGLKPSENVGTSALDLYGSLPFVERAGKATTGMDVIRRVLAGETVTAFNELRGVYFENHISPLLGMDGKVVGIVGIAIDVTERKQAEEEIKSQLEELERWQDVMLGRGDREQKLKREVNELCRRAGESARYPSQEIGAEDSETAPAKL